MVTFRSIVFLSVCSLSNYVYSQVEIWSKYQIDFTSAKSYDNPLYDLDSFFVVFNSPDGRQIKINGFWDGGSNFKVRFAPDHTGDWSYQSYSSDKENKGLHDKRGSFNCVPTSSDLEIYRHGSLKRSLGDYHISYDDGLPFFYLGCTAWNGALKSTDEEWEHYLNHRVNHHYSVIQFVTTQWRGCEKDRFGDVAFSGSGYISINPSFFRRLDKKIERINAHGLIAAPVLLWALPVGDGRHLSPGYFLPENEAILLAKYMVARWGGDQVIWILGGDGRYTREYEQRWKRIGREVFDEGPPGLVAQHPHGRLWIGEEYKDEHWLDIMGYQSSHSNRQGTVDWLNKGPMAKTWDKLPPRPIMNLEPNYEEIRFVITAEDVRNASYWSLFATPISGLTYGANGIWPWIQREGELIENHGNPGGRGPSTWKTSIDFPGSLQIGYLASFIKKFDWWILKPRLELLVEQPGNKQFDHFVSVVADDRLDTILFYIPHGNRIKIRNKSMSVYSLRWFDPVSGSTLNGEDVSNNIFNIQPPRDQDFVGILIKK